MANGAQQRQFADSAGQSEYVDRGQTDPASQSPVPLHPPGAVPPRLRGPRPRGPGHQGQRPLRPRMVGPRGARPRLRMPRQPGPPQLAGGVPQDGPQRWGVPVPAGLPPNGPEQAVDRPAPTHGAAPQEADRGSPHAGQFSPSSQRSLTPSSQPCSESPSSQLGYSSSQPAPHPAGGVQPSLPHTNANTPTPPNHKPDLNQNSNPPASIFQQTTQQGSMQAKPYPNASEPAGVLSNGQLRNSQSTHGPQPLNSHTATPEVSSQQTGVTLGGYGATPAAVQQPTAALTPGPAQTAPQPQTATVKKPQISKVERTLDNFFGKTDKLLAKFDKTLTEKLLDPSHTSPAAPVTSSAPVPAPALAPATAVPAVSQQQQQQQQQQQSERGLLTSLQSSLKGKVSEGLGGLIAPPQPPAALRSLHTDVSQSINLSAQALRAAEARAGTGPGCNQVQISGQTAVPATAAPTTSSLSEQLSSQQQEQLLQQQLLLQQQQSEIVRLQQLQKERERELELKAEQQKLEYQRQLQLSREHERAALAQAAAQKPAEPVTAPPGAPGTKIYVPTPLVAAAAGKVQNTAADLLSLLKPPSAPAAASAASGGKSAPSAPATSQGMSGRGSNVVTSAGMTFTGTGGPAGQGAPTNSETASSDPDFENRMCRRKRFLQHLASLGAETDSPPSPGESPLLALESFSDRLATPSPMSSVGRIDDETLCSERERPSSAPEIKARLQFSSRFGVHIPAGFLDMPDDELELRPAAPSPSARLRETPRDVSPARTRDLIREAPRDASPARTRNLLRDEPRDSLRDIQRDALGDGLRDELRDGLRDGLREGGVRDGAPVLPSSFKSPRERTTLQASLIPHPPTAAAPPDSPSPPERDPSHVIRYCDIESDEESDAESSGPCSVTLEHSPGGVYTIEEAEEEAGTPTAADGVSRRRTSGEPPADRRPPDTTACQAISARSADRLTYIRCFLFVGDFSQRTFYWKLAVVLDALFATDCKIQSFSKRSLSAPLL